nr:unnamed protein product [Digitaria exilis]
MVWALTPVDAVRGTQKYYIFAAGTYKVGRKGAYATRKWSDECTHVLADEACPLTPELLDAVIGQKQIVLGDWFKAMTEKNIHTEIPSCTQYIPNLTLDGTVIKMVEVNLIQSCLAGYTFILGPSDKYQFGEKLLGLLESTGAKYLHIDEFCANSQDSITGDTDQQILVFPARYPLEFSKIRALFPLSKISDVKLFAAALSGRLEATAIEPPAFIVTSSNSTDETIVADSDVEMETATSNPIGASNKFQSHIENISDDEKEITNITNEVAATVGGTKADVVQLNEPQKVLTEVEAPKSVQDDVTVEAPKSMQDDVKVIEKASIYRSKARDEDVRVINKMPKDENLDISRDGACDVIFNQDLVVKKLPWSAPAASTEGGGVNFKRFRKRETVSGNSFKDLVPFGQEPESDYESGTLTDFMREEKQRKQMEAIAEDLFNNAKSKKRAAAGSSIHTLLTTYLPAAAEPAGEDHLYM